MKFLVAIEVWLSEKIDAAAKSCPIFGKVPRQFIKEKRLDAEQKPRGHLAAVRISDGKANAFRESEQDGAMSSTS